MPDELHEQIEALGSQWEDADTERRVEILRAIRELGCTADALPSGNLLVTVPVRWEESEE